MTPAILLAGLAAVCAVFAAWEAIAAAGEERAVLAVRRWATPALDALRSGREPTNPERRRLVALGALSLVGAGWLLSGPWAGLALGAAAPWAARLALRARRRRRALAIDAGAPAIARALADALAGGHSIRGALTAAAREGGVRGAAGEELRAAAAALDFGQPTEDVLHAFAASGQGPGRPHGPRDTLVAAILLQREAGGDLAGLLRALAAALEERARVVADARSATAQARFTAVLVTSMPVGGLVLGELAQPGFVLALLSSPITAPMLVVALALQLVAFVCVRRIARAGAPA